MEKAMPKTSIMLKFRRSSCLYPSFAVQNVSIQGFSASVPAFELLPRTAASSSLVKYGAETETSRCTAESGEAFSGEAIAIVSSSRIWHASQGP